MADETTVQAEGSQAEVAGNVTDGQETQSEKGLVGSLPGPLKSEERLAGIANAGDLATKYLGLLDHTEGKRYIPGEAAAPEDIEAFYKDLGVPDTAKDYKLTVPEDLPEGTWSEDMDAAFRNMAKQSNFTAKQTEGLMDWYMGSVKNGYAKLRADDARATEAALVVLRTEWGDSYDRNEEVANRAMARFFGDGFIEALGPIAKDPTVLRGFLEVGKRLVEDSLVEPDTGLDGKQAEDLETDGTFDYPSMT